MPALELKLEDEDKIYYNDLAVWDKYDPIYIAKNNDILNDMDIYLDAGDKMKVDFMKGVWRYMNY
ncbi:hypothetical protein H477_1602 [[Clostridium] sordellii ATCC 9714]|nr:hypothetical protein H477_1602 [[Clostridium] sordellii ATCC 9714] [Paeniclostridium sordellii ATCC 9714]